MFALNADIEAARAVGHGKGFAVVASEIRKLAENSKRSTEQISSILNGIQQKIKDALKEANEGEATVKLSEQALIT